MKKLSLYSIVLISALLLYGCPILPEISEETNATATTTVINEQDSVPEGPEYSSDQFVVRFPDGTDPDKKAEIRNGYPIIEEAIERCSCGDPNLELWTFEPTTFEVESAKNSLARSDAEDGLEGDRQFTFNIPETVEPYRVGGIGPELIESLTIKDNTGPTVNIAILDSGFDYNKNRDSEPFLFSTQNIMANCMDQTSGWNFVDGNADVTDKHSHGAYVTKTITSQLDNNNVKYQILPVKAFDSLGSGSYWDIICALGYVNEIQKKGGNLHLLNASFGHSVLGSESGQDDAGSGKEQKVFKGFLSELKENNLLFIASAGNIDNTNNDEQGFKHLPSGFDSENIIGVGGYITENDLISKKGNYGKTSIDLAAPFIHTFSFENDQNIEKVEATGSSFSAAFTTARLAEFIYSENQDNQGQIEIDAILLKNSFLNDQTQNWILHDVNLAEFINQGRYLEK